MADELTFEDFAGGGPSRSPSSSDVGGPRPANSEVSFESFAEKPAKSAAFDNTLKALKATGGEAAALLDMGLSLPGFLIGVGGQIGGTIQAAARGVPLTADQRQLNPVTAYGVGRQAGQEFSEPFMNPVKKVLDMFKSGEAYEHAKTTEGMNILTSALETAGKWAEEKSGGRISRDAMPMLAETLMASGTGIGSGKAKGIDPVIQKRMRDSIEQARAQAEVDAKTTEMTPDEFIARVPVQEQINSMLGIRTPAEQAKITRERRADVKQIFRQPEEGGDYGSVAESEFKADERTSNAARFGQAEALDILQKAPEQRSAADIAMLRMGQEAAQAQRAKGRVAADVGERVSMEEAMAIAQKPQEERSNVENTKFRQWASQKGSVSADALGLLAAAGIGATAGTLLDDEKLRGAVLGGVAGLGPAMLMRGSGKVQSRFGQAGAVKGPGGMWHPEAVERLTSPLNNSLMRDIAEQPARDLPTDAAGKAIAEKATTLSNWSEKAIRNYLNKYAGTERDPLKDVEIPFQHFEAEGEGGIGRPTGRWEKAMDGAIETQPASYYQGFDEGKGLEKTPPDEKIFNFGRGSSTVASKAIQSYLSHVGDYLRQNVDSAKLPQYDLTRAVRETAENDKRVAKQMEKAAGDSTKSLPVYKEYPDGFKWVELKLPEKLTEEQGKQVRKATKSELSDLLEMGEQLRGDEAGYVALGPDGKPLKNSYTDQIAGGPTPEEAWLAGRLAEEGNTMGHCVGGYCEGVARGESKIYSLRDAKGKSHVTVEVEPGRVNLSELLSDMTSAESEQFHKRMAKHGYKQGPEGAYRGRDGAPADRPALMDILKEVPTIAARLAERPDDVSQIKGKQNRAPSKEYLPYVQDFVKGGKWGEVGDLENTGLVDVHKHFSEPKTREGVFGGERYLTSEDFHGKLQEQDLVKGERGTFIRPREQGAVSQDLVVGLAGLGLGGVIGSLLAGEDKGSAILLSALAGASLGLPGVRVRFADAVKAADWGLGSLSTRIGNISEAVKLRGRDYERRVLSRAHEELDKVVPFFKEINKLGKTQRAEFDRAILTGDKESVAKVLQGNMPLVAAWKKVQNVLSDLGGQLQGHGRFKTMLEDYYPRLVKDVEGLKEALGVQERTRLEQALIDGDKAAMKNRGTPMTAVEQSSIINREIQGFRRAKGYQPGYAKGRKVDEITEKLQSFYHTPEESLYAYIRGAVQDLELARFFGRDLAQTRVAGQNHINVETSIGNLVGRELDGKRITAKDATKLIDLLQARFQGGERASSRLVQEVRNLGNLGLLGNVVSAVTQLGDVATAIYAQGLRSSLTAIARQLSGRSKITTADFGLADHIAEEFVSPTRTAKWLNSTLKWAGFTAIDRFGKNTNLNAALDRTQRMSRTNEGISRLSAKYGAAFGGEFPNLVSDLKAGRITERVRSMLFSELSDVQPISKMELPQGYLENPNGRLVYMLKTFMLKQADMMRRDVYNELKNGNVVKGLKNATGYALVLGLSGATTDLIKDWMLGRNPHFDATDVAENVLKTFGWASYVRDKAAQGKPIEAAIGAFVPPYKMMDDIIRRDPKMVKYIPIIGQLFYSWELGGKEASEIAQKRKSKEALSPEAIQYQREKREKKRASQ